MSKLLKTHTVGLLGTKKQKGRKFDEKYLVCICIC